MIDFREWGGLNENAIYRLKSQSLVEFLITNLRTLNDQLNYVGTNTLIDPPPHILI